MQWYEKLEKNGFVQITNFLPPAHASNILRQVKQYNHFKKWNLLTTPYYPLSRIKDRISGRNINKLRHKQAYRALQRKQFSFSFYRSSNKHAKQHKQAHLHREVGEKILAMFHHDLNQELQLVDSFFADFQKGQFISYHTDGGAGKYAFIYQLSQGWQEKYGGHLELYPCKIKFYKKSIIPTFNTLTLLKLAHPMPHAVRILNNPEHKRRITISGWVE